MLTARERRVWLPPPAEALSARYRGHENSVDGERRARLSVSKPLASDSSFDSGGCRPLIVAALRVRRRVARACRSGRTVQHRMLLLDVRPAHPADLHPLHHAVALLRLQAARQCGQCSPAALTHLQDLPRDERPYTLASHVIRRISGCGSSSAPARYVSATLCCIDTFANSLQQLS